MFYASPKRVVAEVFATLPKECAQMTGQSNWSARVLGQKTIGSFLEGPSFDRDGNLWVVDIPWGRVFRIDPLGNFELACAYEGEPNGLKLHADGSILIADHCRGLMRLDGFDGSIDCVLAKSDAGPFKGLNDLHFGDDGTIWFTDQGQTGLHDPTGCLHRLSPDGELDCVLANIPSPNGLTLDQTGRTLFLAVTRDNAIWRLPLQADGTLGRVGRFIQLSGGIGPDGLAMDTAGGLAVCHPGLGCVWLFNVDGEPILRIDSPTGKLTTNCAFGGPDNRFLYITESETGTVLRAECPNPGAALFSTKEKVHG